MAHPRSGRISNTLEALQNAGSDSLVLVDSCLDETQCEAIARHISTNKSLTSVDLRGNQLRGNSAVVIANAVANSRSIRSLSLEWNSTGVFPDGVRALSEAISTHESLHYLDLRNNRIGPDGAVQIASAIRSNKSLLRLDLRWNDMGTSGSRALASALEENRTLIHLAISGNGATDESLQRIQRVLSRNQSKEEQKNDLLMSAAADSSKPRAAPLASGGMITSSVSEKTGQWASQQPAAAPAGRNEIMAIPNSLEGAILCIRNLEDLLNVERSKAREIGMKFDAESRAHSRCRSALEDALEQLEREKTLHVENSTKLQNLATEITGNLENTQQELRKEKEKLQQADMKHKSSSMELEEKTRFAESKLEDSKAEVNRLKAAKSSLENQAKELHAEIIKQKDSLTSLEDKRAEAVAEARQQEREALNLQLSVADEGRAHAEERRSKMATKYDSIELELNKLKAETLSTKLQHQKELEATEERVRNECESTIGSAMKQLEAQLKALELSHERQQTRNSEDAQRFASAQGRAAEQLASLQEQLSSEVETGKQRKAEQEAAIKDKECHETEIQKLKNDLEEAQKNKVTQGKILENAKEDLNKELEQTRVKFDMEKKQLNSLILDRSNRVIELETALKTKDEKMLALTTGRNEEYTKIEKDVISRVQQAFVEARQQE